MQIGLIVLFSVSVVEVELIDQKCCGVYRFIYPIKLYLFCGKFGLILFGMRYVVMYHLICLFDL